MAEEKKVEKKKRPTALKRDIQNEKKQMKNRAFKSKVKTVTQSLEKSISDKEALESVQAKLNSFYSLMDKGVKKGIYKQNKAIRMKSRYALRSKNLKVKESPKRKSSKT